ncbi:hypothetical protein pb186bvf_003079 [Paramecium bursaria]
MVKFKFSNFNLINVFIINQCDIFKQQFSLYYKLISNVYNINGPILSIIFYQKQQVIILSNYSSIFEVLLFQI